MTWEEAITRTEEVIKFLKDQGWDVFDQTSLDILALKMALTSLSPVSREQMEKVHAIWNFVGTANDNDIYRCSNCGNISADCTRFCPNCGAPMTDEAVGMVMERLEEMKNG